MKKIACLFVFLGLCVAAKADHITGGEMYYSLIGNNGSDFQYNVTLKLYMRCNSGRQFNNPTIFSIFDAVTNARIKDINVNLSHQENISLPGTANPCISNPPNVCYDVGYYNFVVSLPLSEHGYIIASQVNYRIAGINNLTPGYGFIGATYTAQIPGAQPQATGPVNNSAHFVGSDLVVVCAENPFSYSFAAEDVDGDRLHYSFCNAYTSSSSGTVSAPQAPPYTPVPYGNNFTGTSPLGATVQIDENTGLITGRAPEAGVYVVTVCVDEIRNGTVIATQRKDLQIFIAPCSIAAAVLHPEYQLCGQTMTLSISNNSTSSLIHTYDWVLVDAADHTITTSLNPVFNYTFTDTGIYHIKLYINKNEQCSDSTTALIRVYPGLAAAFSLSGICLNKPTRFTDASTSRYGTVNSWKWDLGDLSSGADVSVLPNPVYTYPTDGSKNITLIVGDTRGCHDTLYKIIDILTRPPIDLAFRDTLICLYDQLQLHASGEGVFNWTPLSNIAQAASADPTVSPTSTTTYVVHLDDQGCLNTDSVRVRVTDHVTLLAMADTVICRGDTIRLHVLSDALKYAWTPAQQLIDPTSANPYCVTQASTVYQVKATIGGCSAMAQVAVNTIAYPLAAAGSDTTICYGTEAQLYGSIDGISFSWTPVRDMQNGNTLTPLVRPRTTSDYVLSAFDTLGCPKPGRDTVTVTVRPRIQAFAGRDTSVVINQPLQLHASGGITYRWSPALYLSSTTTAAPLAVFNAEQDRIRYKVVVFDEANCFDSAFITVKIFQTAPEVFVPTAFTPNGDGLNDVAAPIAVGIARIQFFRIYNRWGQLVFATTENGHGWDGRMNGQDQATGTYVWVVGAVDFHGEAHTQRGTITLIR